LIIFLISGSTPYSQLTGREVIRRVPQGLRPDLPKESRHEFYNLMSRCWHKEPHMRPSFAQSRLEISKVTAQVGGRRLGGLRLHGRERVQRGPRARSGLFQPPDLGVRVRDMTMTEPPYSRSSTHQLTVHLNHSIHNSSTAHTSLCLSVVLSKFSILPCDVLVEQYYLYFIVNLPFRIPRRVSFIVNIYLLTQQNTKI